MWETIKTILGGLALITGYIIAVVVGLAIAGWIIMIFMRGLGFD